MEKVFWLMWLADLCGNIGVVGWMSVFAICIIMGGGALAAADLEDSGVLRRCAGYAKWFLIPLMVAIFAPAPRTVHVLAVSSAAEAAANTKLGGKTLEAMEAVLDKVIAASKTK